jgi:alpha-glucoside transport system permease protein
MVSVAIGAGVSYLIGSRLTPEGASGRTAVRHPVGIVFGLAAGALVLWGSLDIERIGATATAIFIAVFVSAALFIGTNRLFDVAPDRWPWFSTLLGGVGTFIVFALLWGNRVINNPPLWTIVGTVIGAGLGYLLGSTEKSQARLVIGAGGGALLGLLIGLNMRKVILVFTDGNDQIQVPTPLPQLNIGETLIWVAGGLVIGAILWQLRGRTRTIYRSLALWGTLGWGAGAFLAPDYNSGAQSDGIIAATVFGAGIGLTLGLIPLAGEQRRRQVEVASRKYIFLTPALFFIAASLVVPTIRTAWLSFLDRLSIEPVGFQNYTDVFTDNQIINFDGWTEIFTSLLFLWGVVVIGLGLIASSVAGRARDRGPDGRGSVGFGLVVSIAATATVAVFAAFQSTIIGEMIEDGEVVQTRRGLYIWIVVIAATVMLVATIVGSRRGESYEFSPGTISPIGIGLFILAFAVFTAIRGTISNNLWWVFTVTIVATTLGLAIAVLADRGKFENIAKSLIFMPMAISFVGAGIIWRFVYIARPAGRDQTGVLNTLWVWLGEISHSATGTALVVIVLALVTVTLLYLSYRGYQAGANGMTVGFLVLALPMLWLIYRFVGPGLGGFVPAPVGDGVIADPVLFTSTVPFNNVWLMVVLIWIQTGFAMVIFSAAIKAVPTELLEAARVDGATESQSFWRVTIPQIAPTIGVVVTTLIVTVMKVFDIVRVMSGGNFDTNVIANEMYDKAFAEFNTGAGSALAIILFLAILPIMFYNIRRMQKAAV